MRGRVTRFVLAVGLTCLTGCASAPPAHPLGVMIDRTRDPAQRLKAAEQLGPIRDTPDPAVTAYTMHKLLWSDGQPTELRLYAMDRLIEFDEPGFWRVAEDRILELDQWPVLGALIDKAVERGDASFTTTLVRSYTRRSQALTDVQRPERAAIEALNPGRPVEQAVWGVLVSEDESVDLSARADTWVLVNRLLGPDHATSRLLTETSRQPLIVDLQAASWLGQLPASREGLLWLLTLRSESNRAFWSSSSARVEALSDNQRHGLALRHLPVLLHADQALLSMERSELWAKVSGRLSGRERVERTEAGNTRQLPQESLAAHADALCWADLLSIDLLCDALQDPTLVSDLFRQADADRLDTSTEHGGVLVFDGKRSVAESYLPVLRLHDQSFYSSSDLVNRLYTGLFHYHFHAQQHMNADYAGPGPGDLTFVENMGASAVVFTFLDPDTLGVDYYQPGGVVIDLGVVRRYRK